MFLSLYRHGVVLLTKFTYIILLNSFNINILFILNAFDCFRDSPALVTVLEETRHGLETGDTVLLSDITGMPGLNGKNQFCVSAFNLERTGIIYLMMQFYKQCDMIVQFVWSMKIFRFTSRYFYSHNFKLTFQCLRIS